MEGEGIAGSVDASLYPVAVLIDELRHDDLQLRLNAIRSLETIAVALGAERTREELLPFIQEIIDDDDEVLVALAEQLGYGVPWVGGPAHAHALIGPLEELCNVEEVSVRDAATNVLRKLAGQMSGDQVMRHFGSLINRLQAHEWFTSRMSCCSLFSATLPKVADGKKDDLLKTYFRLCADDAPMVRRQAANVLGSVAEVLTSEAMLAELMEVFEKLSKDEQDSVRIFAIENCVALGRLNSSPSWQDQSLALLKACAEDKSWRVRYMVAEHAKELCEVFRSKAVAVIVPLYLKLLADQEVEVRTIAAAQIAAVASISPTKDFLGTLMPAMEKLTWPREQSQHVRGALAGSILGLTPIFGAKLTVDYLLNIFLHLIRDESPEVRLKLIGTLGDLSSVVGVEVLSQSLLPSIRELGKDRQWRVRLAVIDCMPSLAKYLGEAQFTQELSSLFVTWIQDPVFCVRKGTAATFRKLAEVLGMSWCESTIVPQLREMVVHKSYLCRISAVLCIGALAEGTIPASLLENHLVPMAASIVKDAVPNVRINVAKTIQAMHKTCKATSPGVLASKLVPCLKQLMADEDPDVQFFARQALTDVEARSRA